MVARTGSFKTAKTRYSLKIPSVVPEDHPQHKPAPGPWTAVSRAQEGDGLAGGWGKCAFRNEAGGRNLQNGEKRKHLNAFSRPAHEGNRSCRQLPPGGRSTTAKPSAWRDLRQSQTEVASGGCLTDDETHSEHVPHVEMFQETRKWFAHTCKEYEIHGVDFTAGKKKLIS